MKNLGDVCYYPKLRFFGFLRSTIVDFCGKSHSCKVVVGHSFGCNFSRCLFDGFCKDCLYVYTDVYTL